jgi:endonuclease/exonuclease/phosphatase family metal-dependent hydrolase
MFALDRIFGWPSGIVSDLAVHDSPRARRASDHLPLKAEVKLGVGGHARDAA